MRNLMEITMLVEIYYSPVSVPENKRYHSTVAEFNIVTKSLLYCLMARISMEPLRNIINLYAN